MRQFPTFPAPESTVPPRDPVPSGPKAAPADADGVVEVLAAEVRERFGHSLQDLRSLVATEPEQVRGAGEVLRWFDQLLEAQQFLADAEDALVDVLATGSEPLSEDQMELARTVDAAVTVRDGRALVVRFLLNPDAPGKRIGAAQGEALGVRRPPALTAGMPPRPAVAAAQGVRR